MQEIGFSAFLRHFHGSCFYFLSSLIKNYSCIKILSSYYLKISLLAFRNFFKFCLLSVSCVLKTYFLRKIQYIPLTNLKPQLFHVYTIPESNRRAAIFYRIGVPFTPCQSYPARETPQMRENVTSLCR